MANDEFHRIERIVAILGDRARGIGDDAVALEATDDVRVWTVDAQVEGVHFDRRWLTDEDVGFRATIAAASDVLAMASAPESLLVAWQLPADVEEATIDAIALGQRIALEAIDACIVGGNITAGPALGLTTTVLGRRRSDSPKLTRAGGRPGQVLAMRGAVGRAAAGLALLQRGEPVASAADVVERAWIAAWRRPPVLLDAAASLGAAATAAVDVSDGLAQDVGHLAARSNVDALLDEGAVLDASFAPTEQARLAQLGLSAFDLAFAGGEDYALVGAFDDAAALPDGFVPIGRLLARGEGGEAARVRVQRRDGRRSPAPRGFRHGQAPASGVGR